MRIYLATQKEKGEPVVTPQARDTLQTLVKEQVNGYDARLVFDTECYEQRLLHYKIWLVLKTEETYYTLQNKLLLATLLASLKDNNVVIVVPSLLLLL